jgi:GNAT superfamily N-acetyltransferase
VCPPYAPSHFRGTVGTLWGGSAGTALIVTEAPCLFSDRESITYHYSVNHSQSMSMGGASPQLPSGPAVTVRRVRPDDAPQVIGVFTDASIAMYVDGIGHALYNCSYLLPAASFSCLCFTFNWWKLHAAVYLIYLFLPTISAYMFVCFRNKADVVNPAKYFAQPRSVMFVAEMDGKVIGMVGMKPTDRSKGGRFDKFRREGDVELVRMNVSPSHHGLGVSRLLMEEVIRFAREEHFVRIILTSSGVSRIATQILYPKYGFRVEKDLRMRYLPLGIAPVFMVKEV